SCEDRVREIGGFVRRNCSLRFGSVICAILCAPYGLRADLITGGSNSMAKDNGPDGTRQRYNVATNFTASYQTFCSWLIYGMQSQFSGVNFTFAGYGNIGNLFSPVPSTAFALTQYQPW